jgi:Holliday junction resolvasome RuvABC endonuclease subunit
VSNLIKVAGIDPSLRNTGLALGHIDLTNGKWDVDRVAIVQTERMAGKVVRQNSDDYRCARELITGINKILAAHGTTFIFAELPTGAQSARAMFSFGLTTAIMAGLTPPLIQVQPREVQIAALGKAGADKAAIIKWATERWPNAGWKTAKTKGVVRLVADNEHPADACAAIAAGIETAQFAQALALAEGMRKAA